MNTVWFWRGLYAAALALGITLAGLLHPATPSVPKPSVPAAVVKIQLPGSHGSGVHIGAGRIITAAHVVSKASTVSVIDSNGVSREGTVLWSNTEYDVALVAAPPLTSEGLTLACRPLKVGEEVRLDGYPFKLGIVTTFGRVASGQAIQQGQWKEVSLVDGTLAPGMSGGPVTATDGSLVGINVGVIPGYPISSIVASGVLCGLLGRS